MISYIYCFTNKVNNKKYIGSTIKEPNIRKNQHLYHVKHNTDKSNYPLYQAIRKYGESNFDFDILYKCECSEEEIRKIEQDYIVKYNTLSPNGYNQTLNTEHPLMDKSIIKKVSETKREQSNKVVEIDSSGNIINQWRSAKDCEEDIGIACSRITDCCRGTRLTTNSRFFRWLDKNDNIIQPIRIPYDNYKGEKGTTQIQRTSKKVAKLDLKTKEILAIYPTIALASRENKCDASGISKVCKGLRNHAGGFYWIYYNEEEGKDAE